MSVRQPPRSAVWLLEHFTARYHGEALAGDLFEEYQQGRSPAWYWRQVATAMVLASARRMRISALPRLIASRLKSPPRRLAAMLAVAALGVGTLAWAATAYSPASSPRATHPSCRKIP